MTRVVRSPQWSHALWLLVLLKLIAPPVLYVPVLFVGAQFAAISAPTSRMVRGGRQQHCVGCRGRRPSGGRRAKSVRKLRRCRLRASCPSGLCCFAEGGLRPCKRLVSADRDCVGRRIGGLVHAVCRANHAVSPVCACDRACAEAWQEELAVLAARLGLHRGPDLPVTEGSVPPLLWTIGRRPLILLPRGLLEGLDAAGRRALMAHELAHFRRRDHWVRWLEAVVLAVYWWHPVAWWARRGLQAAEERCCDAWAVWLLDGNARSYGETLLTTVDFLTARRPASPVGGKRDGASYRSERKVRNAPTWHNRSPPFLARSIRNRIARPAHAAGVSLCRPGEGEAAPPPSRDWARLSPFTDVIVHGDAATVQFDGQAYELVSIDDIPTKAILAVAKQSYGNLWEKRFVEDIVEVLEQVGRRPEENVKLVLRDAQSGHEDRGPCSADG